MSVVLNRALLTSAAAAALLAIAGTGLPRVASAQATATAPAATASAQAEALVRTLSAEVVDTVKADKALQGGNAAKVMALVDAKLMPHVNFPHMTAVAVGRAWRSATPEQQKRIQEEFKTLLVRTYAGALTQVTPQTTVAFKPVRGAAADATDVVIRSEVKGKGEPVQLDYRLESTPAGWKIYDVNVAGVWLADTSFKSQFAPIVQQSGLDGLIARLVELNKKAAGG